MRRSLRLLLPALALLVALPATASAEKPNEQALYQDGPDGRYLLDGDWLFRLDNEDQGVKQRWMRSTSTSGWTKVKVPNVWNLGDSSNESMSGGIGWYRKDFELPERGLGARVGLPLRVGQLPRHGLAQRQADRVQHRRLRAVGARAERLQAARDEPAGRARGLQAPHHRLPARRPEHRRRADRRLVELLRHPARGLPAQDGHGRLPQGAGAPGAAVRRPATRRSRRAINLKNVTRSGQRATITGKFGNQNLRLGTKTIGPDGIMEFSDNITVRNPRLWAPGEPEPLRRQLHRARRRREGRGLRAQERHPLDQGLQRPPVPQRAGAEHARARRPRGLQGPGLRDRQRAPRGAAQPGQGAGRDLDPHALPVPSVHARARGPHGHPDLVRDPGLHGQDRRCSRSRRCGGWRSRSCAATSRPTRTTRR